MRTRAVVCFFLAAAAVLVVGGMTGDPLSAESAFRDGMPDAVRSLAESGGPFVVVDRDGRQVRPDVAGHPELNDCQNLVVWWDESEKEIWGRFVEREWRGEPFLISGEYSAEGRPKVAYNHWRKLWLVVWSSEMDVGPNAIRGRYVQCDDLEGRVFTISRAEGAESAADDQPVVAPHGEHFFAVAWRRAREGGGHAIVGSHVAGMETRAYAVLGDGAVSEPAIACENRGDCLVAWTREHEGNKDVVGRYWFPREELVGERLLEIAVTPHGERYPSVAWNGSYDRSVYAVTWTWEGPERTVVRARPMYREDHQAVDNLVVGGPVVDASGEGQADHGDVGALGPDFVVVWSTGETEPRHIVARRLKYMPEQRHLVPGDVAGVAEHDAVETYPAVASAGDPLALVVWQIEREDGDSDILGRHVKVGSRHEEPTKEPPEEPTKEPPEKPTKEPPEEPVKSGEPFIVVDRDGRQVRPDVAGHPEVNDCQNLVVWWDESEKEIWGRFVEREWRGEPFLISGEYSAEGRPKVAYNHWRKLWLVVWSSEMDVGPNAIRGRYVQCDDLEGRVFTISRAEGAESAADDQPVVAPHGEHFFAVAWRRAREGGGHAIVGSHVAGTATRAYAVLGDGAVSEPAIACESRGDCLVAWTREHEGNKDVVGRYWFPREEYVSDSLLEIAVSAHGERYPSVAFNGWYDRWAYAVSWTDEGEEHTSVRARTVYPTDDSKLDTYVVSDSVLIVAADGPNDDHGDVAALGPDFVLVWSTGEAELKDILATRLLYFPETRGLTAGTIGVVAEHDAAEIYPAVASAGNPLALAVWQIEREGGDSGILGRHVAVRPTERVVLFGEVLGGGFVVHGDPTWSVGVRRVLEGSFTCAEASVFVADADAVDQTLSVGDMVSVHADLLPAEGVCALSVGAAGTFMESNPRGQVYLPFAAADR